MTYRTKQRDILMDAILSYRDTPFTAEELLVKLINQKNRVSKATVYRTLDMLESEGNIRKYYISPHERAFYQYIGDHKNCHDHYHCVCYDCAKLFHIECDVFNGLNTHFKEDHHFNIDFNQTLLYGHCEGCAS